MWLQLYWGNARAMFNADFEYMAQQLRFKLLDVTQLDQDIRFKVNPYARESMNSEPSVYHKRRHAARTTDEYLFHQLVPYLGNKRRLLHLILEALEITGTLNSKKKNPRFLPISLPAVVLCLV